MRPEYVARSLADLLVLKRRDHVFEHLVSKDPEILRSKPARVRNRPLRWQSSLRDQPRAQVGLRDRRLLHDQMYRDSREPQRATPCFFLTNVVGFGGQHFAFGHLALADPDRSVVPLRRTGWPQDGERNENERKKERKDHARHGHEVVRLEVSFELARKVSAALHKSDSSFHICECICHVRKANSKTSVLLMQEVLLLCC